MSSITPSAVVASVSKPRVNADSQYRRQFGSCPAQLGAQCLDFGRSKPATHAIQMPSASIICSAALNARCGAEQTQTITRESPTSTITPLRGKEKSPDLDDGGAGLPPRDDGGGGGGGGGGGWSGGFFFFGFLALLGLLKDKESENPPYAYDYEDRRRS